jgi:hypothetical protein
LADVGTHVVDLVQWTAFPDTAIDYRRDIRLLDGRRWPLILRPVQFSAVTGEPGYPATLLPWVRGGKLEYLCNNFVSYTIRGIHVKLNITWEWEARQGSGDVYEASYRGTKSTVEIRQSEAEQFVTELYIVPRDAASRADVLLAIQQRVSESQTLWPGLSFGETDRGVRIEIPTRFRVGHEAHFAQVARRFFDLVQYPDSMPPWENANMLAKYYVSTTASR